MSAMVRFVTVNNMVCLDSEQTDVTFVCGGDKINKAHRSVLSTFSPLLNETCKCSACCHESTVILDGFEYEVVHKLSTLLYTGKNSCTEAELREFPSCVKQLGIVCLDNIVLSVTNQALTESLARLGQEIIICDDSVSDGQDDAVIVDESSGCSGSVATNSSADETPKKKSRKEKRTKQKNAEEEIPSLDETPKLSTSVTMTDSADIFQCAECSEEFPDKRHLKKHRKLHHAASASNNAERNEKLGESGIPEPDREPTTSDFAAASSIESFRCFTCQKDLPTERALQKHKKRHPQAMGGNDNTSLSCPKVAIVSTSAVLAAADETFQCADCFEEFPDKRHLNKHRKLHRVVISVEDAERDMKPIILKASVPEPNSEPSTSSSAAASEESFRCFTCRMDFPTEYALNQHCKKHPRGTGDNSRSFNCPVCDKLYKTVRGLEKHLGKHIGSMSRTIEALTKGRVRGMQQ